MGVAHHNQPKKRLSDADRRRLEYYARNSDELSGKQIAEMFGVAKSTVCKLRQGVYESQSQKEG